MKVVWSTDKHFVKPALISILPLLEHASRDVAVHVMGHRLSGVHFKSLDIDLGLDFNAAAYA